MQKFKDLARRSVYLSGVVGLLAGLGVSAAFPLMASADALNPLTERTLLLSSSAPGYVDVDGSGNSTYAPPGSGANGKKTGETFTFKISTAENHTNAATQIQAFTLQYCTVAAGECEGPGDNSPVSGADTATTSDLNVQVGTGGHAPAEITAIPDTSSSPPGGVAADDSQGSFGVETWNGSAWVIDPDWAMTVSNLEDSTGTHTGKNNFITLKNTTHYLGDDGSGTTDVAAGTEVKVQFFPTDNNYITNPGSNAYFVKINDYDATTHLNFRDNYPDDNICGSGTDPCPQNVVDGGVTVANVMNNSILIRSKVLETLDFSVGTHDPDTDAVGHSPCDAVNDGSTGTGGAIYLGDPTAENSLSTHQAFDNFSYWRLSSNSSNGATVYYSGNTLADTENDHIGQVYDIASGESHTPGDNSGEYSHTGSEQFGLGLDVTYDGSLYGSGGYLDDYTPANSKDGAGADNTNLTDVDSGFTSDVSSNNPSGDYFNSWHAPELYPLVPMGDAAGTVGNPANGIDGGTASDTDGTMSYGLAHGSIGANGLGARFAFDKNANTIPVPIASESSTVVNCSTGLMRYVGNIAATTPAGIYTTAINYVAAPEY